MVNVVEEAKIVNQARFVVENYKHNKKCLINDKLECWLHKDRTVQQFICMTGMFYDLKVDSFHLILMSYKSGCTTEMKIKNKLKFVVSDTSLMSDYGIVYGNDFHYYFVLFENDLQEEDVEAICFVRLPKELKIYPLSIDKKKTAGEFYKQVLQLCQRDNYCTESFAFTYNFCRMTNAAELVKLKITEDDTRLLSDIGVVFGGGVNNRFEVSLDKLSDNMDNETSLNLCLPTQRQKTENQRLKMYSAQNVPVISSTHKIFHKLKPTEKLSVNKDYRGLVNQALTCYLNSLLQALYMTPEFRNAIYHWKFDPNVISDESKSIPFQLQKLFLNLQTSPQKSVETKELTHSFGWNSNEVWQQHDVQELCRIMFDCLEKEFKNTTHVDLITQLYQGELIDYVKCQECGLEKLRKDNFLDIPLPIRPFGSSKAYISITEALQGYIKPETLDGANQYYCERCKKKCDASKGLKFNKFPYILTLHLLRFEFDYKTLNRIKLDDKVVFPHLLNLNSFVSNLETNQDNENALIHRCLKEVFEPDSMYTDGSCTEKNSTSTLDEINENEEESIGQHSNEDECGKSFNPENEPSGPYLYELYAIMIHSGNALEGHYYVYIKDFKTDQWFCFNDQVVSEITLNDIEKSFGGGPVHEFSKQQKISTNAYMLMYRQIDTRRNKIAMTPEEFPPHIKDLYKVLQQKYFEELKELREKDPGIFKAPVYFMECDRKKLFDCNKSTTLDQLKTMAMKYFEVTKPCQLVVYNKLMQKVVESLEPKSNYLVLSLVYNLPCVLLLQIDDDERGVLPSTSKNIIMKLFMINLDDNEEDVNVNHPVCIEVEPNSLIKDLGSLLYTKYNISNESTIHFAVLNSSELLILLEPTIECSSVNSDFIFVFIECIIISESVIMQKMQSIVKQYNTVNNSIQLQFVLPPKRTDVSQYLMTSCNINSMNCENKLTPSLEDIHEDSLDDCNTSTKDNYLVTCPDDSKKIKSGDQCEDNGNCEKIIVDDVIGDNQIDDPALENCPIRVYDNNGSDNNRMNETENNNISDKKYMFTKLDFKPISDNASVNDDKMYAFVDKRMTVNELKNHLVPHINIKSDFIILKRYISENKFEELDLPSRSLENLNNHEIIHISIGGALRDGQYRGIIFLYDPSGLTDVTVKEMFHWIIKVGTSVLETKKELLTKLHETQNIFIPLERCRLRKIKNGKLLHCYFNEEIWSENIGQGWEIVILDLKDRFELELDTTKRLMFINLLEENDNILQYSISEMEFVIEIASTTSISIQLARQISTKFKLPEDQLELGYMPHHSGEIIWKTSVSQWSFDLFDYDNTVLFCRFVTKTTTNQEAQEELEQQSKKRRDNSLRIGITNNNNG